MKQKYLITGTAGFIGFFLTKALLERGDIVFGIDNINDYYDVRLKYGRLAETGIVKEDIEWHVPVKSIRYENYTFTRMNLEDKHELQSLFDEQNFDGVVNLAAQAGVRYSLENPDAYIQSNVVGFLNLLEVCRRVKIKHLVYASSSSVYGLNKKMPFSVMDNVDHPVSLYAATKKSNELMAHSYSHLFNIPTSSLRFFTVYGPWGRPDMAYFSFARAIMAGQSIKVFNHGKMKRDFTFIDDIVAGIINVLDKPATSDPAWSGMTPNPASSPAPFRIYNIGNNKPVELLDFITTLGRALNKEPEMEMVGMQPGDVEATWANVDELIEGFGYNPNTSIESGIQSFVDWYQSYYL